MAPTKRMGIIAGLLGGWCLLGICYAPPPALAGPVQIDRIMDSCYQVDLDLSGLSHRDFGRDYARAIITAQPEFESLVDSFLKGMLDVTRQEAPDLNFATLRSRAQDIVTNVPVDYVDEIAGMQDVFSYDRDQLGDGRLSRNEMLVFQLFADVFRPSLCSASAVFGDASTTGHTIIGRNLDWYDLPGQEMNQLHAVSIFRNGEKSFANFGFLGSLSVVSAVSDDHVFASVLDIDTGLDYPDTKDKHSYTLDLRYALENETTLQGAADYLTTYDYAHWHLVALADRDTAQVLENNVGSPSRGLRTSTSELIPGVTWNHPDAIATVNSFLLPGNYPTHFDAPSNVERFQSFQSLYDAYLTGGAAVDMDEMMQISGYPGPDGQGLGRTGAIFRSRDGFPSVQSIVMDLDTLETHAFFAPREAMPRQPDYAIVFAQDPFTNPPGPIIGN
ncbi:MAG: hypothetical protein KQJ78_16000 [Deltaproteobacteria bacterium]|nr:hypothetical protein [Deltaproteobacteria bacterium]